MNEFAGVFGAYRCKCLLEIVGGWQNCRGIACRIEIVWNDDDEKRVIAEHGAVMQKARQAALIDQ